MNKDEGINLSISQHSSHILMSEISILLVSLKKIFILDINIECFTEVKPVLLLKVENNFFGKLP